jgi:hypothetical protein
MARSVLRPYQPKPRYVPKVQKHEESIQRQVCSYLRLQYPSVIFRSDYASGLRLTEGQARIHKSLQSGRSWPDLFVYEPRQIKDKHYCGLALELKRDGASVILKVGPRKGKLSTDKHIQEQAAMLKMLSSKGYYANFAVGFDEAVNIIDWYMGRPENASLTF